MLPILEKAVREGLLLESAYRHLEAWLGARFLPQWAQASIEELVEQAEWSELNDRFYRRLVFGTGGMRGRTIGRVVTAAERGGAKPGEQPEHPAIGTHTLNDINVLQATIGLYQYVERYLRDRSRWEVPKLVIAHDTRYFSRHFCKQVARAWSYLGGFALLFEGPRSTPQLSFSIRYLKATAGVVITASHNPPHDNGFKVYFETGGQLVPPHLEGIVEEIAAVPMETLGACLEEALEGGVILPRAVDEAYLKVAEESVLCPEVIQRERPKVVFTPLHGTGGVAAIPLMKRLGVEVSEVVEQMSMDPRFPTVVSPNPQHPEAFVQALKQAEAIGADAAIATDPDADRMGVAVLNAEGNMECLNGNMIGSVLAAYRIAKLKEKGILPPKGSSRAALIKTFVTTPLQAAIAREQGLKLIETLTGFKWIGKKLDDYEDQLHRQLLEDEGLALDYDRTSLAARMRLLLEKSAYCVFSGEESYGYLANDRIRDKDANVSVSIFCELVADLKRQGKTVIDYLDALYVRYGYFLEWLGELCYEGASGAFNIQKLVDSYRSSPPKAFNGVTVRDMQDFGRTPIYDADGKRVPAQDLYHFQLSSEDSFWVRASGTEPKVKFYLFALDPVSDQGQLVEVKQRTKTRVTQLAEVILADARVRAEA